VIIRGIERRGIFRDDFDRENFLERLSILVPETQTICYAWVFMSNHAHFLLRSGLGGIAHLMRRLLTGYAVSFNRRHRRHGQLFQNRYKSIICQEDVYFKELVRYIHLNPVRAKVVPDLGGLNQYPYCGHSALMNKQKRDWQDTDFVLSVFGNSPTAARRSYNAYVKSGYGQGRRPELTGGGLIRSLGGWAASKKLRLKGHDRLKGDERILGDSDFVTSILAEANEKLDRYYEMKSQGYNIEKVENRVMEIFDLERDVLYSKGRSRIQVAARSLLCYWAVRELGLTATELARRLGVTQPAVSYAVSRGERIAKERNYRLTC
jgi:REP element-mobilizing transposase RayT/DNA-binding transcriptional ArsR family regulator